MSINKYPLLIVPERFNIKIGKLNKELSLDYSNWILSLKDERIELLKKHLSSDNIQLDCSNESLKSLFNWFKNNISFRNKTEEEIEEYKNFKDVIIKEQTFTPESISLIFDIALFWGECLINKTENIKWFANYVDNGDIGYAFPIIGEDSTDGVNPRQIIEVVAYKLMDKKELDDEFNELLNIWISMF